MKSVEIPSWLTWLGGALVAVVGYTISSSLPGILEYAGYMITAGVAFAGATRVPIAHKAVYTILAKRIPLVTDEGYAWTIIWLTDLEEVDCKEHPIEIQIDDVYSSDNIPVHIEASVQLAINDPYLFLSVDNLEGKQDDKGRNKGGIIPQLTEAAVREFASEYVAADNPRLPENRESVSRRGALVKKKSEMADTIRTTLIRQQNKQASWGVDFRRVVVSDIRLPERLANAFTNIEVEEAERIAETIELEHVTKLAQDVVRRTGVSYEEALATVQSERGKAERIRVEGKGTGDLTKAAGVVSRKGRK